MDAHRDIDAALDAFERVLSPAAPADMAAFARERVRLARSVNGFLADERAELDVEPASARGHAERRRIHAAVADLRLTYSEHVARWNNQAVAADWTTYRRGCAKLTEAMRRLLTERAAARPLRAGDRLAA